MSIGASLWHGLLTAGIIGGVFCAAAWPARGQSASAQSPVAAAPAPAPASLWFFAAENDVPILLDRLNADPEIAFLVSDGPLTPEEVIQDWAKRSLPPGNRTIEVVCIQSDYRQRWRAVRPLRSLNDGEHSLWHIPAGPLPLLRADRTLPDQPIPNPWSGWTEERPGCQPYTPYFGPAWPAEIRLALWTRRVGKRGYDLVASSLQWAGGPPQTRQWWDEQEVWFGRTAARFDDPSGTQVFWAFPSALEKLKAGARYYANGFELGDAIRQAVIPRAGLRQ